MSCPMYADFTRGCVKKYRKVIQIPSFDICKSDNYDECPMYNIIIKNVEYCEYTPICDEIMDFSSWDYEHLKYIATNFCFYGKKENCAIYNLKKENKIIPKGLQPDGRMIESKT